jgi:Tfp pilus assembly protein PilO
MIGQLGRREKLLAAAGLLIALLVLGGEGLGRLRERSLAAASLVPVRQQLLERKQDLIARRQAIAADLQATTGRLDALAARFLTASTPGVAASELSKVAKDVAAQARTEIRSERILPAVERGELLEIPLEIAVAGDVRQLVDLLSRLEAAPKLMVVQDLRIRVVNVNQPRELLTTLTLSGFILPGKART